MSQRDRQHGVYAHWTKNNPNGYEGQSRKTTIDWARLGRAVEFFKKRCYRYIEVPWYVPSQYTDITHPFPTAFTTVYGDLVGSAEQSLLCLAFEGKICLEGRYVACTPCFRDNQPNDEVHGPTFMKVELFQGLPTANRTEEEILAEIIHDAAEFYTSEGAIVEAVRTEDGWDLNCGGLEIGSYGIRQASLKSEDVLKTVTWCYGTGLAEPRFSQSTRMQRSHFSQKIKNGSQR